MTDGLKAEQAPDPKDCHHNYSKISTEEAYLTASNVNLTNEEN